MATSPKILAFAGSLRKGSYNRKLIHIAVEGARAAGGDILLIDLKEYPMPPYDGDIEEKSGLPEHAKRLKELMKSQHGLLIASPEYNSSVPGTLKNIIDWVSRPEPDDDKPLPAFNGKAAALMSASPSWMGGVRCLLHLRSILGNIRMHVHPQQVNVSGANEAFNDDDALKDEKKAKATRTLGADLVQLARQVAVPE